MNLHLTRDEWERIAAAGAGVLFRNGFTTASTRGPYETDVLPPAEFVAAVKPCETCGGTGKVWRRRFNGGNPRDFQQDCDDCIHGKRRIAVTVPCRLDLIEPCAPPYCDGTVTVGHVVVEWAPTLIDDDNAPQLSALGYEGQYAIGIKVVDQ